MKISTKRLLKEREEGRRPRKEIVNGWMKIHESIKGDRKKITVKAAYGGREGVIVEEKII